jgi:hypothetical protein
MTDPRRLAAGGEDVSDLGSAELTRWLIDSARHEEPGAHALQRTLVGVGATGAVLAATASASAVSSSVAASGASSVGAGSVAAGSAAASSAATTGVATAGTVAAGVGAKASTGLSVLGAVGKGAALKWLAVSVVGGATLVGAGSKLITPTPVATPAPQAAVEPHRTTPSAKREVAQEPQPAVAKPAEAPEVSEARTPSNAPTPAAAPNEPAMDPEVMEATALHKEVQLIDRAREAKAAGQHARVVALSQEYLVSFPRGRLMPEAISLKMESEHALGRNQQAAQTAKLLLRVAPNSPQAKLARELSTPAGPGTP